MNNTLSTVGSILVAVLIIGGALWFIRSGDSSGSSAEPSIQHAHGLAVDVANENRLLIATHHGLLQLTDDSMLSQVGNIKDDLMGFTPHPSDPTVFFSSGHPSRGGNLGFQKSTDGGLTWEKVSNGINGPVDFHSMTVSSANPNIVYGHFGILQRSKDGGLTWEIAKGSIRPYSLSTDAQKENIVYAATDNGVQISEDYGDTWKSFSSGLEGGAVSAFSTSPDGKITLVFSQTLGGMGKSTDRGQSWQKVSERFNGETVTYIAFSKTAPSIVYALTGSNGIYKSVDSGDIWQRVQ